MNPLFLPYQTFRIIYYGTEVFAILLCIGLDYIGIVLSCFSGDNNIKTAGANMSYGNRLVMQTGHKSANLVSGVEKVEWMKVLQDTLPVCKISIPGTHDSGSTKGGCMLKTQTADIPAQLQKGIRAFDIRLKEKNGKLGVFHSHAFQDIYWEEDVLLAFISFLQAHPSETLIVTEKEGGR